MTDRLKRGMIPLSLAAASFALALAQRPGAASSDTKVDLHVDPAGFLAAVTSPWTDAYGLGAVWSGQYSGYLWPMGPFFALGHALGLEPWLVHRLWLGSMLALAAWGAVKLIDVFHTRQRGVAHLVAGAVAVLNPYTVVFANRTSITLLAYASLPWLLVCVQRGLHDPRGWTWPAAFALVLASAGGGVNAATTAWVLLAPVLLALYELWVLRLRVRDALGFALRVAPLVLLTSAWWIVPTLVQAADGIDFLRFTEQPSVIWHTTSLAESLRGMGYWTAYTELGFGGVKVPFFSDAGTLLFDPLVLVASLLGPALALASFAAARRYPYAPFLLGMTLVGAFAMMAGFPEGSPLRRAITAVYENVEAVRFLRTTYKAGPLTMFGIAGLLGLGAERAWAWLRPPRRAPRAEAPPQRPRAALGGLAALVRHPAGRAGAAVLAAALLVFAALPFFQGRAVDRDVEFTVPAAWSQAAADIDRTLPAGTRTVVLPGSLFGFYDWGGVTDPAFPVLSDRPTASRFVVPYSDLRAIDLLWTVDGLVQEQRTLPGQLPPLLDLMGAGAVIAPFDYDARRAGSTPPADSARALAAGGLLRPNRSYGDAHARPAASSSFDEPLRLPTLRRYDLTPTGGSGLVRVRPRGPATVVDGSAPGVTALAAFGQLDGEQPLLYAADQSPAELRRLAREGASIVITDSNRKRAFVNSRIRANTGRTLDAGEQLPPDVAVLDPFGTGSDAQTVAVYGGGARYVRGTIEASFSQFPERGPIAALDSDPRTSWITNAFLRQDERPYLEVGFPRARDVETIGLLPYGDRRGRPVEVRIAGKTYALQRGWNRLRLGLRDVSSLRVEISRSAAPPRGGGPGGIRELRVSDLRISERLRTPLIAADALRGQPLDRSRLTVLLERTTPFSPLRLSPPAGELQDRDLRNRADTETGIEREIALPAARRFAVDAWVSAGFDTPDAVLDRLAGYRGPLRFGSSARFEGVPGRRASKAFDGRLDTSWIGAWLPGQAPWIEWRTSERRSVRSLRLATPTQVRVPTRVRLHWPGGTTASLPVRAGGLVRLPRPIAADRFRLEILAAAFPPSTPPSARRRRAVGIREITAGTAVPTAALRRTGELEARCGDAALTAAGSRLALRPSGTVADLDAGRALRARGCDSATLPAGRVRLSTASGPLRLDLLRLDSLASRPRASTGGGRVLDPGDLGRGELSDARLAVDGPSWLVLGESYSKAWRASCDGQDLGEPVPIDGYANGWRIRRCERASFSFGPTGTVRASYGISAFAVLALLVFLLFRRPWRTSLAPSPEKAPKPGTSTPVRSTSLPVAAAAGALAALILGLAFALRAGVVAGPVVGLVLWRGIGARTLALAAAALLGLVVPAFYLLHAPDDLGGFNSNYPIDLIGAHWVAVLAAVLAALALVRATSALSRQP